MLTLLRHSDDNAIAFRAHDLLTDEDYREVLVPALEKWIAQKHKVRLLMDCDEDFRGWEPEALWEDSKFGRAHVDDFERIALVGGPLLAQWGARLVDQITHIEVKTFDEGEYDKAWAWLTSD